MLIIDIRNIHISTSQKQEQNCKDFIWNHKLEILSWTILSWGPHPHAPSHLFLTWVGYRSIPFYVFSLVLWFFNFLFFLQGSFRPFNNLSPAFGSQKQIWPLQKSFQLQSTLSHSSLMMDILGSGVQRNSWRRLQTVSSNSYITLKKNTNALVFTCGFPTVFCTLWLRSEGNKHSLSSTYAIFWKTIFFMPSSNLVIFSASFHLLFKRAVWTACLLFRRFLINLIKRL